jgi:hypothetical protein
MFGRLRSGQYGDKRRAEWPCSASSASDVAVLNRGLCSLIEGHSSGLEIRSLKGMPRSESQSITALFRDEIGED